MYRIDNMSRLIHTMACHRQTMTGTDIIPDLPRHMASWDQKELMYIIRGTTQTPLFTNCWNKMIPSIKTISKTKWLMVPNRINGVRWSMTSSYIYHNRPRQTTSRADIHWFHIMYMISRVCVIYEIYVHRTKASTLVDTVIFACSYICDSKYQATYQDKQILPSLASYMYNISQELCIRFAPIWVLLF